MVEENLSLALYTSQGSLSSRIRYPPRTNLQKPASNDPKALQDKRLKLLIQYKPAGPKPPPQTLNIPPSNYNIYSTLQTSNLPTPPQHSTKVPPISAKTKTPPRLVAGRSPVSRMGGHGDLRLPVCLGKALRNIKGLWVSGLCVYWLNCLAFFCLAVFGFKG